MIKINDIKILDTEVFDDYAKASSDFDKYEVSVLVDIEFKNKKYYLDYQTSIDVNYKKSTTLKCYKDSSFFMDFRDTIELNNCLCNEEMTDEKFNKLLQQIGEKAEVQNLYNNYIEIFI